MGHGGDGIIMSISTKWSLDGTLLTLAISSFPFYVFPSGSIQPSHLFFFLVFVVAFSRYGAPAESWIPILLFVSAYAFIVEAINSVIYDQFRHLITPAFYLFNLLLSIGVYQVVRRKGAEALRTGILVATVFAVGSVYVSGVDLREIDGSGRAVGTFNNPNQLGYFSACLLSLSYLLYRHSEIRFLTMLSLFAASLFLSITSLSKAAMIANFAVLVFTLQPHIKGRRKFLWLGLAFVIVGGAYLYSTGYFDDFRFYKRLENMASENDSSLDERGYFAFLSGTTAQLIFGMGSPEVFQIVGHEVHSTFASVLNYYGIVGFLIFISIFIGWWRALYRAYGLAGAIALQGPAILYGITHDGTRFSVFWLLFSASLALAKRTHTRRFYPILQRPNIHSDYVDGRADA